MPLLRVNPLPLADAVQESAEKSGLALPLSARPVAFVFGPENGAVSIRLVEEAAREAYQKSYTHLYVIGFAIQPECARGHRSLRAGERYSATYVQATPDLMMGDLLQEYALQPDLQRVWLARDRRLRMRRTKPGRRTE